MIRVIFVILMCVTACLSANLMAQVTWHGQIIDKKTLAPIPGVDIYCYELQRTVSSDNFGRYTFHLPDTGTYTFAFFGYNYQTHYTPLHILKDKDTTIALSTLNIELSSLQIIGTKKEYFALKQLPDIEGTSVYAGKKTEVLVMDKIHGNKAANVGRQIYSRIPGLNIYEGSDGGLQLSIGGRGLDPNRTSHFNTRQNGYDISADVLGYPENYYTPPPQAINEIQITRGAGALQYGSQFGGLVNFILYDVPPYKSIGAKLAQTVGSYGLFNSFNAIGVNHEKISVNIFYNYKKGNGYRPNSAFNTHNFFISATYRPFDKTSIKAEFTYYNYLAQQAGGLTDQQFETDPRMSTRERNWFEVDWKLYNLKIDQKMSTNCRLSLNIFALDAERNTVGYRGDPLKINENPIRSVDETDAQGNYIQPRDVILGRFQNAGTEIRWLTHYPFIGGRKSALLLGTKLYFSKNKSVQGPGTTGTDPDFTLVADRFPDYTNQSEYNFPNQNMAFFAENIFYMSDKLSITPGVRFEYILTKSEGTYHKVVTDGAGNPLLNERFDEYREYPRKLVLFGLGLEYKKSKAMGLYANLTRNYRSVTFSDIRIVSPTFVVDPAIDDESGYTFDLGTRGSINKLLTYNIGGFSIWYNERIGVVFNDRAQRVRKNIGDALIAGVETLFDINVSEWTNPANKNLQVNCFVNFAYTYSRYIRSEERNVKGKKVEFVPNINMKAGVGLRWKNLHANLQYTWLTQQYTDAQNSPIDSPGGLRDGIVGEIPGYDIMDLSLSYTFHDFKINVGINNLLDHSYFTRRATGYPGPGIIPSEARNYYMGIVYKL